MSQDGDDLRTITNRAATRARAIGEPVLIGQKCSGRYEIFDEDGYKFMEDGKLIVAVKIGKRRGFVRFNPRWVSGEGVRMHPDTRYGKELIDRIVELGDLQEKLDEKEAEISRLKAGILDLLENIR